VGGGGAGVVRVKQPRPQSPAQKCAVGKNHQFPLPRIYRSGDLARFLPNGDLEYLGRIDQQVKIRGHRIELPEIESVMLSYEPVKEAVVLAREAAGGNRYLCAYYVADNAVSIAEFRGYLGLKLPEYMIPAYFVPLEKIPLTPNYKVDRKRLPEPEGQTAARQEYEAPQDDAEIKLAEIWQEALKNGPVSANDNFFYLGGDSIKAIHLISKINQGFHTNIKIKDLYLHQTIKELAGYLQTVPKDHFNDWESGLRLMKDWKERILTDPQQARYLPEGCEDFYPLSFIQQGMVFFSKLRPEEPVYHDQFPYLFKIEQFNLETFNSAVKLLIQRHPILRTTFHIEHFGEPLQVTHSIQSKIIPWVAMEDLSAEGVTAQEQKIKEYMANDLRTKFTFENELLWRMRLFELGRQDYCLILSFQHAILDGWSVASLIRELIEVFELRLRGVTPGVEPLKSSYKDYVAINLNRADTSGETGARTLEFWKKYLQGFTRNKLPFNISGRKIGNTGGSRILRRSFDIQLEQGLEQKTVDYQCSLQDICLAAHVKLQGIITTCL
jgi:acyl carrier protein